MTPLDTVILHLTLADIPSEVATELADLILSPYDTEALTPEAWAEIGRRLRSAVNRWSWAEPMNRVYGKPMPTAEQLAEVAA